MSLWNELSNLEIKNKARYQKLFSQLVARVQKDKFKISPGIKEFKEHFIVTEESRMDSYFIHLVPKQAMYLFKAMQPQPGFLGFSVLTGKHNNKDIRVSCFGVECSRLGKSLIKPKQDNQPA